MEVIEKLFGNEILYHTFVGVLIVLVSAVIGKILKLFLLKVVGRVIARTPSELDDRIVNIIQSRTVVLFVAIGIYLAIQDVRTVLTPGDETVALVLHSLNSLLFIAVVFIVTRLVVRIIDTWFHWNLEKISRRTSTTVTTTVGPLASKVTNVVVFLVAVIVVLDHFGINIGSLLVSLGVGSLAVALAAQDTLANMIAGFVIMIDRPFRVGDRVLLPSGEMGDVQVIGLRSTRILNFDNNLVIIPNAELVKNQIINVSYPAGAVRVLVDVGVAYGTDIEKAKQIVSDLAKKHTDVLPDPVPEVFLMDFGDSAIKLRLVARTDDYRKRFRVETMLREQIYKAFTDEGIEIPFPQRVVHISNSSPSNGPEADQETKGARR
jgi:MscS family membrane protein